MIYLIRTDVDNKDNIEIKEGSSRILGRADIDCDDQRVSSTHCEIQVKNEEIKLKSLHVNPCFILTPETSDIMKITSGHERILQNGDRFGLLPDSHWYKVEVATAGVMNYAEVPIKIEALDDSIDVKPDINALTNIIKESSIDTGESKAKLEAKVWNVKIEPAETFELKNASDSSSQATRRRNPNRKKVLSNPGDPNRVPVANLPCPFGAQCRMRNMHHRREMTHPPDTVRPKTSTERSRETRARKKNILAVKKRPKKTAAEYSREYRARKKALKNAANERLTNDVRVVNRKSPQPHTDNEVNVREKDYPLLYKYLNGQSNSDNKQVNVNCRTIVVPVDVYQQSTSPGNPAKPPKKTAADYSRAYRARKKYLKNAANLQLIDNVCVVNHGSSQQRIDNEVDVHENNNSLLFKYLNRPSFVVQNNAHQQNSPVGNPPTNAARGQSIGQNYALFFKKIAKTPAERCREYRARQKAKTDVKHHQSIT